MSYRQLTEGQRYQISVFLSQEFSQREIASKYQLFAPELVILSVANGFITTCWLILTTAVACLRTCDIAKSVIKSAFISNEGAS